MRVPIVPEGWKLILPPFFFGLVGVHWAATGGAAWTGVAGASCLALSALLVNFFRDPDRSPSRDLGPRGVLSPADGKVVACGPAREERYPGGEAFQVAVFMNVFDNHVNRSPVSGIVERREYFPGRFLAAFVEKSSTDNEQAHLLLRDAEGRAVLVKQIAGLLARRVVTRVGEGDRLERGRRFGCILLGSRVDVFLPPGFRSAVKVGDRVKAGVTVLGEMP